MKKIFVCLSIFLLSSCFYMKGDYTLGPRDTINDFFYTYNIRYYADDDVIISDVQEETINDYKIGVVRHAVPGGVVATSRTVRRNIYSREYVRPNKKGGLVSYTVPADLSDEKVYKLIGESTVNGVVYRLVEPNRYGDVLLIDEKGLIYPRLGRIYNGRLALGVINFIVEPADLKFVDELESKEGEEDSISHFELRYQGIQDYMMVFVTRFVGPDDEKAEEGQTFRFPMYDSEISIDNLKLEILNVNDSGIEYRML